MSLARCDVCGVYLPAAGFTTLRLEGGAGVHVCRHCNRRGLLSAGCLRRREDGNLEIHDPRGVVLGALRRVGWFVPGDDVRPDAEVGP